MTTPTTTATAEQILSNPPAGHDLILAIWTNVRGCVSEVTEYNSVYDSQKQQETKVKELDEKIAASDDPQVVKLRKEYEKAEEAFKKAQKNRQDARLQVREYFQKNILGETVVQETELNEDKVKKSRSVAVEGLKFIRKYAEQNGLVDIQKALDVFELPAIRGVRGAAPGSRSVAHPTVEIRMGENTYENVTKFLPALRKSENNSSLTAKDVHNAFPGELTDEFTTVTLGNTEFEVRKVHKPRGRRPAAA